MAVAKDLALLLILFPIHRLTGRVILAEIAVVLVEASVIQKIFTGGGAFLEFRRALIYAGFLNLITYLIGVVTQ